MTDEQVNQLLEQQQTIIEKLSQSKGKDKWDKLSVVSTFLSTIIIGVLGIYFTYNFKSKDLRIAEAQQHNTEDQLRIAEAQFAASMVPVVSGENEAAKKGALLAISTLSNKDLFIRLATTYPSEGAIEVLETFYERAEGENKNMLCDSLIDALFARASNNYRNYGSSNQIKTDCNQILSLKAPDELKSKNEGRFLSECYRLLGYAYYTDDKYGDALAYFRQSLEICASCYQPYWSLGAMYWGRKDSERSLNQALDYYNQSIQHGATSDIYLTLGQLYLDMNRVKEAIDALGLYIKSTPYDYKGYYEIAKVYKQNGQRKAYYDNLKKAQSIAKTQTNPSVNQNEVTQIDQEIEDADKQISSNIDSTKQVQYKPKNPPPKKITPNKTRSRRRF